MVLRFIGFFLSFSCIFVVFQNCDTVHIAKENEELRSVTSLLPYNGNTQYFDDVQVFQLITDSQNHTISFDIVLVDAVNEDQVTDVEIQFLDEQGQLLCPRVLQEVQRETNHILVEDCVVPVSFKLIDVSIAAAPKGESLSPVRTHRFYLEEQ